jgi:Leucine-rich repeat (LRR) protein
MFKLFKRKKQTNPAQEVLNTIFEDHKERTLLNITPFGDIIYTETNKDKSIVYSVLQIYIEHDEWVDPPNYYFKFKVHYIATSQEDWELFCNDPKDDRDELFESLFQRVYIREMVQEKLGDLDKDEIYGFSDLYYNTEFDIDRIQKIQPNKYFAHVLNAISYYKPNTEEIFTTEYECNQKETKHIKSFYISPSILQECQSVFECKNLQSLTVSNSFVLWKAEEICKLENLNYLNINHTGGGSVWDEQLLQAIATLHYLVDISISGKSLPLTVFSIFSSLKSLKRLTLNHAELASIDTVISKMKNLEVLDLSGNNLSSLPKSILQLKKLKILRLANNSLAQIPEWIDDLEALEELDISNTMLTTLPQSIAKIPKLKKLKIKKNRFTTLPSSLKTLDEDVIALEATYRALYDNILAKQLKSLPKEDVTFSENFNLKLIIINKLMYEDEILLPKFDIYQFVKTYDKRRIDIEEEGYEIIPEVKTYFENLKIPTALLWDIKELYADGGDSIYFQLMPHWSGEEEIFDITSTKEFDLLPNLKKFTSWYITNEVRSFLEKRSIKVNS